MSLGITFENMKTLDQVRKQQVQFIKECEFKTQRFIKSLPKESIEFILLSGSVARGDYMPGKYGGMIDLTVVQSKDSTLDPVEVFGKDEEPDIPYHCVYYLGQGFQIAIHKFLEPLDFYNFDEPKKFAFLESKVIYDKNGTYENLIEQINISSLEEINEKLTNGIGYINYLLSEYKTDRWLKREAYPQLHFNLNKALEIALKCFYYINGQYCPAEDRFLYYCSSLPKLNPSFNKIITELYKQDLMSLEDYKRRKKIFNSILYPMITS